MVKVLQDLVKYTIKELESYVATPGSCVKKINKNLHISVGPYGLADIKHAVLSQLIKRKVGYYDSQLKGIVLDIKNIKIFGELAAIRADDHKIHINLEADCYIFQPFAGAALKGTVKHIGTHHLGVIIYRVFNADIRLAEDLTEQNMHINQDVLFRIKNFNLNNEFPYIQGELVTYETYEEIMGQAKENESDNKEVKHLHELDQFMELISHNTFASTETESSIFDNKLPKESVNKRKKIKTDENNLHLEIKVDEDAESPSKRVSKSARRKSRARDSVDTE